MSARSLGQKRKRAAGVSAAISLALTAHAAAAQEVSPERAEDAIRQIQESHIAGNVPAAEDFDRFLKRDLAAYFQSGDNPDFAIEYELMRDGPTQSGIAYPKYYVWVRVLEHGSLAREGAARLAAIERKRFAVTHFIERAEIEEHPSELEMVFPVQVIERIREEMVSGSP